MDSTITAANDAPTNDLMYHNISDFPANLRTHSHEEADTLIILHEIDVARENPFTQLYIYIYILFRYICFLTVA